MQLTLSDFDGIAFDFDGTLADSFHHHEQARFEAFSAHGFGDITMEEHRRGHTYGNNSHEIVGGLLKAGGKIPKDADPYTHPTVQKVVASRNELFMRVATLGFDEKPGAAALVRAVAQHFAHRMAIVTTARTAEVWPFLKKYDLDDLFSTDSIIAHETIEALGLKPKAAPDAYLLAMERLNITDPARLLVIEDVPGGVEAAKRAHATVLAVATTVSHEAFYDKTLPFHPDHFAADFASITLVD